MADLTLRVNQEEIQLCESIVKESETLQAIIGQFDHDQIPNQLTIASTSQSADDFQLFCQLINQTTDPIILTLTVLIKALRAAEYLRHPTARAYIDSINQLLRSHALKLNQLLPIIQQECPNVLAELDRFYLQKWTAKQVAQLPLHEGYSHVYYCSQSQIFVSLAKYTTPRHQHQQRFDHESLHFHCLNAQGQVEFLGALDHGAAHLTLDRGYVDRQALSLEQKTVHSLDVYQLINYHLQPETYHENEVNFAHFMMIERYPNPDNDSYSLERLYGIPEEDQPKRIALKSVGPFESHCLPDVIGYTDFRLIPSSDPYEYLVVFMIDAQAKIYQVVRYSSSESSVKLRHELTLTANDDLESKIIYADRDYVVAKLDSGQVTNDFFAIDLLSGRIIFEVSLSSHKYPDFADMIDECFYYINEQVIFVYDFSSQRQVKREINFDQSKFIIHNKQLFVASVRHDKIRIEYVDLKCIFDTDIRLVPILSIDQASIAYRATKNYVHVFEFLTHDKILLVDTNLSIYHLALE